MTTAISLSVSVGQDAVPMKIPVGLILVNSAAEIGKLARMVRRVEAATFHAAMGETTARTTMTGELHQLDFILQTLTEMGCVLYRLGQACDAQPESRIEATVVLGPIKLAFLRQALASSPEDSPTHDSRGGPNIELF